MVGEFKVTVNPSMKALARIIKNLGPKYKDWRPAWRKVLPIMASEMANNLRSEGAPIGARWTPLKQATLERKMREGLTSAALVASSLLLNTISSKTKGRRSLTRSKVSFGPNKLYQLIQQFGVRSRGVKGRRYMGLTTHLIEQTMLAMNNHSANLLAQASREISGLPNV